MRALVDRARRDTRPISLFASSAPDVYIATDRVEQQQQQPRHTRVAYFFAFSFLPPIVRSPIDREHSSVLVFSSIYQSIKVLNENIFPFVRLRRIIQKGTAKS
jgi:hypothetical protein